MDEDATHNRFKHLLQPIRDLVGNWNVDIAGELGDYLNDLVGRRRLTPGPPRVPPGFRS